jgi:hypothetical protein
MFEKEIITAAASVDAHNQFHLRKLDWYSLRFYLPCVFGLVRLKLYRI